MAGRGRVVATWVVSGILALLYLLGGIAKLAGMATEMFAGWGYAAWFAYLVGVLEVAGAIGLLIPRLRRLAAMGLILLMVGAAYTHLANGEGLEVLRPLIFMLFLGLTVWLAE